MMKSIRFCCVLLMLFLALLRGAPIAQGAARAVWPAEVRRVTYTSPADGTAQPAMAYNPGGQAPVPLLVALHS